jgi:membrane-associated protease RseP (regulator of RpoE activity)
MIRKLPVFILLSIAACTAAFGQQRIEPVEKRINRIILSEPFVSGYLGVQTQEVTKENFAKLGLREVRGIAIEKVVKDSPAAQAGIRKGDVIVRFGGEEVTSVFKLTRLLNEIAPDHQAKITILRGGAESELTVTLGKREMTPMQYGGFNPEDLNFPGIPEYPRRAPMPPNGTMLPIPPMAGDGDSLFVHRGGANRQIGVSATSLTKQLADFFGVANGDGLLINNVRENSPAAKAGLKAGDIIIEADGKSVKNNVELIRTINDKKDGDVTLTIVRDKNRQTVRVTPEISKDMSVPFQYFGNFEGGNQRQQNYLQELKRLPPIAPPAAPPQVQQLFAPRIL